ncbi:hypothetical protein SMACR_05682 [Sordaria macrospora]|uniref:WGS project CABT00000000 data, contig 2.30 n=2 Tax=Sordaria macrospora TaxID=5147 RepID=F7W5D5_SORMK|nr:uncharacterized protein SMAC_05682 [Sordaria macrospora k-hell]KAA8629170.1 hypothetical protein SMACR_05682 [Sordaria macrospora]WPJ65512.1 hypothetical protein SMAC4_05682 [Sordaria macrospora]CCC12723.1 unnamed protein product [Sordaria macrospora k-hell]
MKASSFLSLLALAIMTFMMLGTTALPGGHPLENRGLELDAKKKHSAANPPNTGWVLKWCKYTAPMIFHHVPDYPLGFPLKPACQRHDFAYRNYQAQYRFTPHARMWIDQNFLKEDIWANLYFWGVWTFYKHHKQYREDAPKAKARSVDAITSEKASSQLAHVFDWMEPGEARGAANERLSQEKMREHYDRALERAKKSLAEAGVKTSRLAEPLGGCH